jgi:hypothetical protein
VPDLIARKFYQAVPAFISTGQSRNLQPPHLNVLTRYASTRVHPEAQAWVQDRFSLPLLVPVQVRFLQNRKTTSGPYYGSLIDKSFAAAAPDRRRRATGCQRPSHEALHHDGSVRAHYSSSAPGAAHSWCHAQSGPKCSALRGPACACVVSAALDLGAIKWPILHARACSLPCDRSPA